MTAQAAPAKTRKPTRLERKIAAHKAHAIRVAAPYGAGYGAAALAAMASGRPPLALIPLSWGAAHASIRTWEHWGWHRQGGKAAARKRRKHQGHASRREINAKLSLAAARRNAAIMRPSFGDATRCLPAPEAGVYIGKVRGTRSYGGFRDSYVAFGPPGGGKTNWMAGVGLDVPGAALFTSTRADMAGHTAAVRSRKGPVYFLNPGGDGDYPTATVRWSPVEGCKNPRVAMASAGALMHAAPKNADGRDAHWDHQSKDMLQFLLHAADLIGADITRVRGWAGDPIWAGQAQAALEARGADGWADRFTSLIATAVRDERYWSAISSGVLTALAWLDDPVLAEAACPAPGTGFNPREFILRNGTVYLIATDDPHNPVSPYFACFTSRLRREAKKLASVSPRHRLDPPMGLILDEPAITCPVPLDRWSTDCGGDGLVLVTGFQSAAQLPQKWGEHGGATLRNNFTVKIMFGGMTDDMLTAASKWGGMQDTWHKGPGGKVHSEVPAFPEEQLRQLDLGQAFVVHRNTRAFIARQGRVEDHPLYEQASPSMFTPPVPDRPRAITAAPRPAIPMPAASPPVTIVTEPEPQEALR